MTSMQALVSLGVGGLMLGAYVHAIVTKRQLDRTWTVILLVVCPIAGIGLIGWAIHGLSADYAYPPAMIDGRLERVEFKHGRHSRGTFVEIGGKTLVNSGIQWQWRPMVGKMVRVTYRRGSESVESIRVLSND